jgi:uncharacterized damage-inducible protein DinB
VNSSTRRTLARLERDFDEFQIFTPLAERRMERISAWSVGEHLDHLMKVDRSIFDRIEAPVETPLRPLSTLGRIVLWSGWIPRGKGKAPDMARPQAVPPEQLVERIRAARDLLDRAVATPQRLADPRRIAKHYLLGGMSAAQWLRFLAVHHHHHVKIIRDVLRADPE